MFLKMYVDEPDNWQPIEETRALQELGCYYKDVDLVVECLCLGGKARTPFAFYRWTLDQPAPSYTEYFQRGLITAAEWSRLQEQDLKQIWAANGPGKKGKQNV